MSGFGSDADAFADGDANSGPRQPDRGVTLAVYIRLGTLALALEPRDCFVVTGLLRSIDRHDQMLFYAPHATDGMTQISGTFCRVVVISGSSAWYLNGGSM